GRFGASSAGNGGVTVPFQIGLQARLTMGPNRRRDRQLASERRAAAGSDSAAARPGSASPAPAGPPPANPVARIMSLRDSLRLAVEQIAELQSLADSLDVLTKSLRPALQRARALLTPDQWRKVPEPLKSPETPSGHVMNPTATLP